MVRFPRPTWRRLLLLLAPPLARAPSQDSTFLVKGPGIQAREAGLAAAAEGRFADAVPLLERAARAPPTVTPRERAAAAGTENSLGGALKNLGRHDEALAAYGRALSLLSGLDGVAAVDAAVVQSNAGAALAEAGRAEEAESRYNRALAALDALEDADDDAADDGRHRADVLNNLADLRHGAGRLDEARALHERALALREEALGPRHAELAGSLNNVAVLLMDLRRHDEAVPLLKRAVRISREAAGRKHPRHATALTNLASALMKLRRAAEAKPHLERALAINTEALGEGHASTRGAADSLQTCRAALDVEAGHAEPTEAELDQPKGASSKRSSGRKTRRRTPRSES